MESKALRYKVELARCGMKDGLPSHHTAPFRLEQLLTYKKDWPILRWSHEDRLQIPRPTIMGVSGGFLYHASENSHGNIFQWTLELYELLSFRIGRNDSRLQYRKFHVPFDIRDVIIDPSQCLLVLVELNESDMYVLLHLLCVTLGSSPHCIIF